MRVIPDSGFGGLFSKKENNLGEQKFVVFRRQIFAVESLLILPLCWYYLGCWFGGIYTGNGFRQNRKHQQHATVTTILALTTLGDARQIEMILSVSPIDIESQK